MRIAMTALLAAGAIALWGCGPTEPDQNASVIGNDLVDPGDLMDNHTMNAPAASGPLSGHVGKYPFVEVDGVAFRDHPLVRAGIARAAGDAALADIILTGPGPSTPIAMQNGKLLSWGCEQHNCGPHNWTLLIAPDGSSPELCYHKDDASPTTRWLVDGRPSARTGDCPSEDQPAT